MNRNSRLTLRWPALAAAVIALLAVGAGTTYLLMQKSSGPGHGLQETASPATHRRRRRRDRAPRRTASERRVSASGCRRDGVAWRR